MKFWGYYIHHLFSNLSPLLYSSSPALKTSLTTSLIPSSWFLIDQVKEFQFMTFFFWYFDPLFQWDCQFSSNRWVIVFGLQYRNSDDKFLYLLSSLPLSYIYILFWTIVLGFPFYWVPILFIAIVVGLKVLCYLVGGFPGFVFFISALSSNFFVIVWSYFRNDCNDIAKHVMLLNEE